MKESRLTWQCRRGMRELDVLLTRYLKRRYAIASDDEKAAFEALLGLSDPEIAGYLLNNSKPESSAIADVVNHIRLQNPA